MISSRHFEATMGKILTIKEKTLTVYKILQKGKEKKAKILYNKYWLV